MSLSPMFAPIVALVLWSLVMWALLYATRIPAMNRLKVPLDNTKTPADLAAQVPPNVRWKADNYNHLMEHPTVFYATALVLALVDGGNALNGYLAWGYVALRIAHSLIQATVNVIMARFLVFTLSTIVLIVMAVRAAMIVF